MKQEFRAVVAALDRDRVKASLWPHTVMGEIEGKTCCVLESGMGSNQARAALNGLIDSIERPELILSIGLAGGLLPSMRIGQKFLVHSVENSGDEPLRHFAALSCIGSEYQAAIGSQFLVTVDRPVLTPVAKAELMAHSGAGLCDMETFAIADLAGSHGLPWIGARIVSDSANETLRQWYLDLPSLIDDRRWQQLVFKIATHPQDFLSLLRLGFRMKTLERQLRQFTVELIRNVVQP